MQRGLMHVPEKMKHELADLSGSQAALWADEMIVNDGSGLSRPVHQSSKILNSDVVFHICVLWAVMVIIL